MDPTVWTYFCYLALSIALTIWVARTLSWGGRRFLVDVFQGREDIADSVNHLLVVGFYLVNLGYVSLALRLDRPVPGMRESIEALSWKVGLVLVVLGAMHFGNMLVFQRIRAHAHEREVQLSRLLGRESMGPGDIGDIGAMGAAVDAEPTS